MVKRIIIYTLLYIALFAYFRAFSDYGFNIWDEGGYAYGTLRTYNGQMALRDFNPNGYLPGRYLYGALFFKLFGVSIQSLRLGVLLLTPGMVLMTYAISRRIMPAGFAFLAALCVLSAPAMYYNRFYPFFTIALMCCMTLFIEKKRFAYFSLSFVCAVIAAFFKLEVALFGGVIGVTVVLLMFFQGTWRSSGDAGLFAFSRTTLWLAAMVFAAVFAALGVYAIRNEIAGKLVDIVIGAHEVWGNPFPEIFPFRHILKEYGPHQMFERVLFYLPLAVYFLIVIHLIVRLTSRERDNPDTTLHLLSIVSFGICAFGLVVWRAGFDNLLRTLPPFYILFCYLLYLAWGKTRDFLLDPTEGAGALLFKRTALNVTSVFLPFLFYYEMNAHQGFYAGSIGAMRHENGTLNLERLRVHTHPTEAQWMKDIVDIINIYTRKGDPIFAIPLNPIFYYLTDRINPTPYDWILPGMLDEEAQKKVVEQLKANKPKLMVYVDIPIDGREERRFSRYAPIVFKYIAENYRLETLVGFFQILAPPEGSRAIPPPNREDIESGKPRE